jgi:hypothetical protein
MVWGLAEWFGYAACEELATEGLSFATLHALARAGP